MPRILLSVSLITITLGALALGGTRAFFSDVETSANNTFAAGAIDLLVDNESYYNGVLNEGTSWTPRDLTVEKFFNFLDLKPDDYGEDTISLHVDTNDAYLCGAVTLTSNSENGCNEPEGEEDLTCGESEDTVGAGLGELASLVEFLWWADDGDNVLEDDETVISEGTFNALPIGASYPLTLADSETNIWNEGGVGGPVTGDTTYYIGKAWCFGEIGIAAVPQDGGDQGRSPAGDNGGEDGESGEPEDGGITCNGTQLGNESQTDSLTADVAFSAVQARHNARFTCDVPTEPDDVGARLTLVKEVVNDDFGTAAADNWTLTALGATSSLSGVSGDGAVTNALVAAGQYTLSEEGGPLGYTASEYECVVNGGAPVVGNVLTLVDGDSAVCTIVNDDTTPIACVPQQRYADRVVSFDQGVRKNGTAIVLDRTDPTKALGAPQSTGAAFDNPVVAGSFFSLGFDEGNGATPGEGGWIIVEFTDNYLVDGPGNDLRAWEITGGTNYPVEKIKIEVSQNGSTWFTATSSLSRDAEADLASTGLTWARFVRLTDVSDRTLFEATGDGYDLDAFSALNCRTIPLAT